METNDTRSSQVVLVDVYDRPSGYMEKLEAHRRALLHRAVSVFVFTQQGLWLLQRRAFAKYHSGGLWSNACCTHPYPGEQPLEAAHRRLQEEMGLDCPLEKLFSLIYRAPLDHGLTEYEYDHIFAGWTDEQPKVNADEVCEWRYISPEQLAGEQCEHPRDYTVWFRKLYPQIMKHQSSRL